MRCLRLTYDVGCGVLDSFQPASSLLAHAPPGSSELGKQQNKRCADDVISIADWNSEGKDEETGQSL